MQGAIVGQLLKIAPSNWFLKIITNESVARLIASMCAGFVQMVVLFPMEKFVLMREKKTDDAQQEAPQAEAE